MRRDRCLRRATRNRRLQPTRPFGRVQLVLHARRSVGLPDRADPARSPSGDSERSDEDVVVVRAGPTRVVPTRWRAVA